MVKIPGASVVVADDGFDAELRETVFAIDVPPPLRTT